MDRYWPNPTEMVKTGEHTWSWQLEGPSTIENWPGKRFFIYSSNARSHAFVLTNLHDFTLEDVNYWGGGVGGGYYIRGIEGTTTFRRFVIGVPPGSNRLYSCAGGGQVSGLRGKLVLDQCDFSKIDDDGIDILSQYNRIIEQKDKRTLIVNAITIDYRPGDRVEIWDWKHKKLRSSAIVISTISNPDNTVVLNLDRDVVTERVGAGDAKSKFSHEAILDGIDRIINVSTVGQETIIRDSKFQVFRAKCLNLKAANCTIERCTFSNSFQPAVFAAPEWYFEEGSSIRNLTVRDCIFTDNNHPNIVIGPSSAAGRPGTKATVSDAPEHISYDNTNILIEGNRFFGYGTTPSVFAWTWPVGPAITITNAAKVVIRDNIFGPLAQSAPKDTPKILIEKSKDVIITNNKDVAP
ncbi:MAG: right-handed parallel beta-helix repeat-containing protein [Verrucomicrobia bacterium]|nr:right-handed parallel beta-helix repeat-containing protein [Verrucomicrobiota bacterium]